jgi:FAD/FMN-containing dehydrogenase
MGKYGLALDNLRSLELVTAEGKVVRTSPEEEPDLFWAVRGGGGNFGVATSLEYRLHAGRSLGHRRSDRQPVRRSPRPAEFFRDSTASLPDEHTIFGTLTHAPGGSGTKVAAMATCHCGSLEAGEKAMRPLKRFGSPVLDAIGPMPYCQLNGMLDVLVRKGPSTTGNRAFLPG